MSYNLKSIKADFASKGIFYTPPELVAVLKAYAPPNPKNVYDPTCGDGALLEAFGNIPKYGQEINEPQLEVAKNKLTNFNGYCGDTLADPAFIDMKFDLIMANPPFSIKWTPKEDIRFQAPVLPPPSKADYAFLMHILYLLDDSGTAVVLNFPGILYRGNKEGIIRKWLIEMNYIDTVVHIPGDSFIDTKIATALLVLKKNRTADYINFEDKEHNITRQVPLSEIASNEYNLSVSSYLQPPEPETEPVDPVSLEQEARASILKIVRNNIELSKHVHTIDPTTPPISLFLDDLQKIIDEHKMV